MLSPFMVAISFVVAVIACIALAKKTGINIGIPAILFAYIIGYWGLGMTLKEVYSSWNINLMMAYIAVCGMFYFARENGAMQLIGKKLLYATRKAPWSISIMFFLIGAFLSFIGSDVTAILALMSAMAFSVAADLGIHPIAIIGSLGLGAGSGSLTPWAPNGLLVGGFLEQTFSVEETTHILWASEGSLIICQFLVCLVCMLVVKGYKVKSVKYEKPEAFNDEQKKTLFITFSALGFGIAISMLKSLVGGPVLKSLAGFFTMPTLGFIAIIIMITCKLGQPKKFVKDGIPWSIILLSGGLMLLVSVATKGGMPDFLASVISGSIPTGLIAPLLCLMGGIMSVFAGATTTVYSTLMAVAIPLAASTGLSPAFLSSAILAGAMTTAVSPFSTGGATILAYNTVPEWEKDNKLFNCEIITAFGGLILPVIFALLGLMFH